MSKVSGLGGEAELRHDCIMYGVKLRVKVCLLEPKADIFYLVRSCKFIEKCVE